MAARHGDVRLRTRHAHNARGLAADGGLGNVGLSGGAPGDVAGIGERQHWLRRGPGRPTVPAPAAPTSTLAAPPAGHASPAAPAPPAATRLAVGSTWGAAEVWWGCGWRGGWGGGGTAPLLVSLQRGDAPRHGLVNESILLRLLRRRLLLRRPLGRRLRRRAVLLRCCRPLLGCCLCLASDCLFASFAAVSPPFPPPPPPLQPPRLRRPPPAQTAHHPRWPAAARAWLVRAPRSAPCLRRWHGLPCPSSWTSSSGPAPPPRTRAPPLRLPHAVAPPALPEVPLCSGWLRRRGELPGGLLGVNLALCFGVPRMAMRPPLPGRAVFVWPARESAAGGNHADCAEHH